MDLICTENGANNNKNAAKTIFIEYNKCVKEILTQTHLNSLSTNETEKESQIFIKTLFCVFEIQENNVSSFCFVQKTKEKVRVFLPNDISLLKNNELYELKVTFLSNSDFSNNLKIPSESFVIGAFNYKANADNEMNISTNDVIKVIQKCNNFWWLGLNMNNGQQGLIPTNYVYLQGHNKLLNEELCSFSNVLPDNNHFIAGLNSNTNNDISIPKMQQQLQPQKMGDSQDADYFEGYANLQIHWEMLHDSYRTLSYKNAIDELSPLIKDKIVLDVGVGSGILSIFCAKAGAKHVYGVDASSIINHARAIVTQNNLDDRITLIQGKIEEIILPVEQVDFIISEWMGTLSICESMLVSVLIARDKYLAKTGSMIPSTCSLYLCPLNCTEFVNEKIKFWDDVYGVDMSVLKSKAFEEFFDRPVFARTIPESEMASEPAEVYKMDMKTLNESDLENILGTFSFVINKEGLFHGFGSWFSVNFSSEGKTILDTGPKSKETHWRQVMFLFEDAPFVKKDEMITGIIFIERNKYWRRHYEVVLKFTVQSTGKSWQKRFPVWR